MDGNSQVARWTSKEIVLNTSTTKEAILYLEALQKLIKKVDIIADYFPGKIQIRFEGAKEHLKESIEKAKLLHQTIINMLYPDDDGFYEFDITFLSQMTGKTFPVKTLMRILELMGYKITRDEEFILSTVDYQTLMGIISKLDEILASMPYEVSTSSLRDVLATIAVVQNLSVQGAIERATEAQVIQEDDYHRLSLVLELEQAIEKCLVTK